MANAKLSRHVCYGFFKKLSAVAKITKSIIAGAAQNSANSSSGMAMVNVPSRVFFTADSTHAALRVKHSFKSSRLYSVNILSDKVLHSIGIVLEPHRTAASFATPLGVCSPVSDVFSTISAAFFGILKSNPPSDGSYLIGAIFTPRAFVFGLGWGKIFTWQIPFTSRAIVHG